MDTLKTGFIVVLLLAVLYGVYVVLNNDQTPPTAEIAWHQQEAEKDLQIEIGLPSDGGSSASPISGSFSAGAGSSTPADLGIPSAVRAELSPTEESGLSKTTDNSPLLAAVPGNLDAPTPPTIANNQPATKSLLPSGMSNGSVSAPSLLADKQTPPVDTSNLDKESPVKPRSFSSLPRLREPTFDENVGPDPATIGPEALDRKDESTGNETNAELTPITKDLSTYSAPSSQNSSTDVPADPIAGEKAAELPVIKPVSTAVAFEAALREAHANVADEKWYQALFLLSKFYNSPDLSSQQQQELIDLLDPLAAKVIYSQEHLVTDAHEVKRGETLDQIARTKQIPTELLANINGIEKDSLLVPGSKVKVVPGPFRADVDLSSQQLTLFTGDLYAGRFPISIGKEPQPQPGDYQVMEKQLGKDYFAENGQVITPDNPRNPYGSVWLGLGRDLSIHGSPEMGDDLSAGCISLSPLDAYDVFNILSQGSAVSIH